MRPLLKQISLYSLFAAISAVIGFISVPILTRFLTPEAFGTLSMFDLLLSICVPLLLMGSHVSLRREYVRDDFQDKDNYLGHAFIFPSLMLGVFALMTIAASRWLSEVFSLPAQWVLIALLAAWLRCYFMLWSSLLHAEKRALYHGLLKSFYPLLTLLGMLFFIGQLHYDWRGQAMAILCSSALIICLSLIYFFRRYRPKLSLKAAYLKDIAIHGLPLLPYSIGHILLLGTDRLLLSNYATLADTGVYTGALKIASALLLIMEGIRLSWEPWLYPKLKRFSRADAKNIRLYYLIILLSAALMALATCLIREPLVTLILSEEYSAAQAYLPWLLAAFTFYIGYALLNTVLMYEKRTLTQGSFTLALAAINLVASYFALAHFGPVGVAMATCFSYAVGWGIILLLVLVRNPALITLKTTAA